MNDIHEPTIDEGVLRPTHLEVDLDQLAANYRAIAAHAAGASVMPILKANAYGHGLVRVAQLMEDLGAACLGVAYLEEGIRLRRAGVRTPILVMGGIVGSQIPAFIEHDLTLTASSVDKLVAIDEAAASMGKRARVHLKIDTGMERIGVHYYSAETLLEASVAVKHVDVQGIFSHFAMADEADDAYTRMQFERFMEVLSFYERHSLPTPLRHIANSAAIAARPDMHLDLVRPGILLYGVYPSALVPRRVEVAPALTWKSRVVYFKVVKPNHPVSYGATWSSDHMVRLITIPVGYGDGYPRAMSGSAEVLLGDTRYPVVGRICMDQVMVNIEWDSAWNGDEVILLGGRGPRAIQAEELAGWAGTIPYEILTGINTRVPRVYLGGNL